MLFDKFNFLISVITIGIGPLVIELDDISCYYGDYSAPEKPAFILLVKVSISCQQTATLRLLLSHF